jgi:hypothetical protein
MQHRNSTPFPSSSPSPATAEGHVRLSPGGDNGGGVMLHGFGGAVPRDLAARAALRRCWRGWLPPGGAAPATVE